MGNIEVHIRGISPVIFNSAFGMAAPPDEFSKERADLAAKSASKRTEAENARLRLLEARKSLYTEDGVHPAFPPGAIRRLIEDAARKTKDGGKVREGVVVVDEVLLYDRPALGETLEEVAAKTQFSVPVKQGMTKIVRTRAKFDEWGATCSVSFNPATVDAEDIRHWLELGGSVIGIGDWRPQKSGRFGRFEIVKFEVSGA